MRLMQQADVVVYDRLVSVEILDMVRRDALRIYAGKERSNHVMPQESINDLLVRLAKEGKRVLRLKGVTPLSLVAVERRLKHYPVTASLSRWSLASRRPLECHPTQAFRSLTETMRSPVSLSQATSRMGALIWIGRHWHDRIRLS